MVKQLSEIIQSLRQSSARGPFPSSSSSLSSGSSSSGSSSSFSSSDGSFSSSGSKSSPLTFEPARFSSAGSPSDQSVDYGDDYESFSPAENDQRTGRSRKQKQARRHLQQQQHQQQQQQQQQQNQQQQQQQKGPSKSFGKRESMDGWSVAIVSIAMFFLLVGSSPLFCSPQERSYLKADRLALSQLLFLTLRLLYLCK